MRGVWGLRDGQDDGRTIVGVVQGRARPSRAAGAAVRLVVAGDMRKEMCGRLKKGCELLISHPTVHKIDQPPKNSAD